MGIGAAIAGGVSAAASLAGGAISAGAAGKAGQQQSDAAKYAADLTQQRYDTTRADLLPYNTAGQSVLPQLASYYQTTQGQLDDAFSKAQAAIPKNPTQANILQMPGYSFNLSQGTKALTNLTNKMGYTGNVLKAGLNYATGLASNYYQNYFGNAQTQYADASQQLQNALNRSSTVFNQIYTPASLGENAAAQTGSTGANLAASASQAIQAAGQAQAAGTATTAAALNQGLTGAGNAASNALMTNALLRYMQGNNPNTGTKPFQPSPDGTYGGQQVYTGPTNTDAPTSYDF